jgi:predicted AlkP superfamily phosphohydrolase/phosphomutase
MSRSLVLGSLVILACAALAWFPVRNASARAVGPVPKTIILGFDGMDYSLTKRWMDAGDMPNFKRLADKGLFGPLQTTNPAQSPVSWAVFNTGCNPGKTGVAGFVSRTFERDKDTGEVLMQPERDASGNVVRERTPIPRPMLGDPAMVPADDFVTFPMALGSRRAWFLLLASGAGLLAGLLLFKLVLRLPWPVALVIALGAAGGGYWLARRYADSLPADGKVPYVINPMQGTSFWHYLDQQGLRTRGVQVASTYPPDHEGPHTQILAGLGVPDVTGSNGSWTVYTDDEWIFGVTGTNSGGHIVKLYEDTPGVAQQELIGPLDFVRKAELTEGLKRLKSLIDDPGLSTGEIDKLKGEQGALQTQKNNFDRSSQDNDRVKLPFTMKLDRAQHAIDFTVGGRSAHVAAGGWSEMIPVEFVLNSEYKAEGLVTFHVVQCDDKGVRVLVPPINIDPKGAPPQLPISAPAGFAGEMEDWVGHAYETLGWACITNPLKDADKTHIPEQSFMDDMQSTEALRESLLMANLARPDEWDVYFQVFSTPDRVGHMLFREFDPDHPLHDEKLASTEISDFGRKFPLKDAIRQVYMNEDRMLGNVLNLLDAGKFGDDALLLIVSDHGFTSFRRQVNLNNVLHELGYLDFKLKPGSDQRYTLEELENDGKDGSLGQYVDWTATRAYSMGLGEVFVNLKGREPTGIVLPADYDKTVDAIRADLLKLKDTDGTPYVTSASRSDVLYTGPWVKAGKATRLTVGGKPETITQDGFADIFLGYAPHYRVSWGNTMGSLDTASVTDNDNHWSGDHVSVDPVHVPGILLSNRRLPPESKPGLIDVAPTILERYGINPAPPATEMDGHILPFENLTR